MAQLSLKGKLVEAPELKKVGKNNTPLTVLKITENEYTKKNGKWEVKDTNHFELQVWGDKAMEAQLLEVGDILDFSAYVDENGKIRHRVVEQSYDYEWKGETRTGYNKTAFEWEIVNND